MTQKIEFEGKIHEFPDDFSQGDISTALSSFGQEKTLFSTEGITSAAKSVIPSLVQGIMGSQLAEHERILAAHEANLAKGTPSPFSEEDYQLSKSKAEELRGASQAINEDLQTLMSGASRPLRWVQGIMTNVVSNAPGVATGVLARNLGATAGVPGVMAGMEAQRGQSYAENRTPNAEGKIKASQADALLNADVQGTVEGAFEMLPTGWLLNNLGKKGFTELAIGYFGRELGTELPTTVAQNMSDWATVDKDMPIKEFFKKTASDLLDTAVITMGSAPIMSAGAKSITLPSEMSVGLQVKKKLTEAEQGMLERALDADLMLGSERGARTGMLAGMDGITPNNPAQEPAPVPPPPTAEQSAQTAALIASIDGDLIDDAQVEKAKAVVAKHEASKQNKVEHEIQWLGFNAAPAMLDEDASELGATVKQAANGQNYVNPNTGERKDRPFLFGPGDVAGKTMGQVPMTAGTYTLGVPTEDRSQEYLQAVHDTVEQWRKQFMPNATIVVSNEQLATQSALGSHTIIAPGQHLIVPAVLRNPSKGLNAFNAITQATAFYNLTHEFGHGIVKEHFLTGVANEVASRLVRESETGLVSEGSIAALPLLQQAVVREFNSVKQRIISNKMSALEFVQTWMSPGKLNRARKGGEREPGIGFLAELGVLPTDNAMDVVKKIVARAAAKKNITDGTKSRDMRAQMANDFLSLDEYLAEQTARHAYAKGWDKKSPLGNFFAGALKSLRAFFAELKKENMIKPGVAFTDWIEGLSKSEKKRNPGKAATEGKLKGAAPKKKKKKLISLASAEGVFDSINAEKLFSDGRAIYADHEQGGGLYQIRSVEELHRYAMDQLYIEEEVPSRAAKKTEKKPKAKRERTPLNEATSTEEQKQATAKKLLVTLVRTGVIESTDAAEFKEMQEYIRDGDWAEFVDAYRRYAGKNIKLQLNDEGEMVGLESNVEQLVELFGLNMYTGEVPSLVVKELVQNSFDAIKGAFFKEGRTDGKISIVLNEAERKITVSDNGRGMTKEILLKSLLTIPGSNKTDLPIEERSGGFGQAKQLFLLTPESIEVITTRDGKTLVLEGTPRDLLRGTAKLSEYDNGDQNGTTITFKVPEKVVRNGEVQEIKFPKYKSDFDVLQHPPLFPHLKIDFQGAWSESIQNLLLTHTKFKEISAPWGVVEIYKGKIHTEDMTFMAEHRVMSAGVWQFNTAIKTLDGQRLPMDLIFNIKPKVTAKDGGYPFTVDRQGIKPHAQEHIGKAISELVLEYYKERLRKHIEAYTNVWVMPTVNDQKMQGPTANQLPFAPPKFNTSMGNDNVPVVEFIRGVDRPRFYYNGTNKNFLEVPGASVYFAKLANVMSDFLDLYTREHDPKGNLYLVGVGFDRGHGSTSKYDSGWAGLHFSRPYHAIFLNPHYSPDHISPEATAAGLTHDMMHEMMHINKRSHDAAAFWELGAMYAHMDQGNMLVDLRNRFQAILYDHWDTFLKIKELYNATDTTRAGGQIKGDALSQREYDAAEKALGAVPEGGESASSQNDGRGPWRNTSLELDVSEHPAQRQWLNGLKNFVVDYPRLRRAVRWVTNAAYYVLEIQQLAHVNPDLVDLAFMVEKNGEYNRYKAKLQAKADAVLHKWKDLGKENASKVQKFLFEEAESQQLWFNVEKDVQNRYGWYYKYTLAPKAIEEFQRREIDEETAAFILEIKNTLLNQLDEAELALISVLEKRYAAAGTDVLMAAMVPVRRHIADLRKVPFFPQGRFGNRILIIEQERDSGGYEIVWREHFESATEWEAAWKKAMSKKAPNQRVRKELLSDQHYVLMALPSDFLDLAASELDLNEEQVELLTGLLQPVKREKVLKAYDQAKLGIKGYSADAMRSFADHTWHNSNMLAKLIHRADFNLAIRSMETLLRAAKTSEEATSLGQVERLQKVADYMKRTRDYIMAPPNEAQQLRALVSIGYLGLNVKTALLNTAGMMTTWSDITSRLGMVEGNKLFMKASLQTFRSLKFWALNERKDGNYLDAETQKALDQAIEEGVLSQSYAYHLAGMANAGNLQRLRAYQAAGKYTQTAIDAAMYLFRLTELSTRRATFLMEFALARKKLNETAEPGMQSWQAAYDEAVTRTNLLQNDYSLGNRVPFMRGIKAGNENILGKAFEPVIPLATVFMSFAQHMAFHAYGGYELGERRKAKFDGDSPRMAFGGYTMKLWILVLLLAGYEGLPGMENLLDMLEMAWRRWGGNKPIRQELREMVQAIDQDPQLFARGFGHNVAGFDISRSLGMGRLVPGTDSLAHPRNNPAEELGTLVLDLMGPTGGYVKFGMDMIGSDKPKAEQFERLPGGLGNIYTAYRWTQQGVLAPSRARITFDLETGRLRDLTADEILGKGLGFNPTVVSQNREVRFYQYDRKVYYTERRQGLLQDVWRATDQKDREAIADAKKAVREYNEGLPEEHKAMRITGADISRSLQTHRKQKSADEAGTSTQRRMKPVYRDVKESFDQP